MRYDFGAAACSREEIISSGLTTRVQLLPEQKKRLNAQASTRSLSGCLKVIFA